VSGPEFPVHRRLLGGAGSAVDSNSRNPSRSATRPSLVSQARDSPHPNRKILPFDIPPPNEWHLSGGVNVSAARPS
jgi:hypothetical protein